MTEQEKKELQERVKSVIERVNNAAVQVQGAIPVKLHWWLRPK